MASREDFEKDISPMDATAEKISPTDNIGEIIRVFEEADEDNSGGLDMEEFCVAMKLISEMKYLGSETFECESDEDFKALHMKIDTNCDSTVDINELCNFLLFKDNASSNLELPFPKPFEVTPVNHYKTIVKVVFKPFNDAEAAERNLSGSVTKCRKYLKGQYLSVTSDGVLNIWTDRFESPTTISLVIEENKLPYMKKTKMFVNDMTDLPELKQIAVSTNDRELLFYKCSDFTISNALILQDNKVTCMDYWSDGTKALFSFGDSKGYVYIFISDDIQFYGLFCQESYEKISLRKYPTVYISSLLKKQTSNFHSHRRRLFNDACSRIRFIPNLEAFTVCSASSREMGLIALSEDNTLEIKTYHSKSGPDKFTCVEYCANRLVTGGEDGLLRVWIPGKTKAPNKIMEGHTKPVIHVMYNKQDKLLLSLSHGKNVRVWCMTYWTCKQSIQVEGLGTSPISSVCYNTVNNEFIVATSDVAKNLGRGTEVFQMSLNSHSAPLGCALYHGIFKQVISVCQKGVATLWSVMTGKAELQFKITPDEQAGLVAVAFDGTQRRLITICHDGKVRLWNFNNGEQLVVLSDTVPKKVSGIVCKGDRILVSGMNSRAIFNMDLENKNHRYMMHEYLEDVCSMDLHENTLITASSNGYILVWKLWSVDLAEAVFWINSQRSPMTNMVGKGHAAQMGRLPVSMCKRNVTGKTPKNKSLLLCLKTRVTRGDTATLITYSGGYIYAWSPKIKGGLLGKFKAVRDESAVLTTMSTDVKEKILLTGDSEGHISLWDIERVWSEKEPLKEPFEITNGWKVSLCPPTLLGSWKAHLSEVVSVAFDSERENVITAGLDCNVRLWTNTGCFIGLFGRHQWDLKSPSRQENLDHELQIISSTEKDEILAEEEGKRRMEERRRADEELAHEQKSKLEDLEKCASINESVEKARPVITDAEVDVLYRRAMRVLRQIKRMDKELQKPFVFSDEVNEPRQRAAVKVKEGTRNSVSSPDEQA